MNKFKFLQGGHIFVLLCVLCNTDIFVCNCVYSVILIYLCVIVCIM
jgi:hypothetical protein